MASDFQIDVRYPIVRPPLSPVEGHPRLTQRGVVHQAGSHTGQMGDAALCGRSGHGFAADVDGERGQMSIGQPISFEAQMRRALDTELREVSAVLVEEAIEKIAENLRRRVGDMAVAIMEQTYDLSSDGRTLTIRVQLAPHK